MGIHLSRFFKRIFDYPLKCKRPDVFYQSDIDRAIPSKSDYDMVVEEFTKRLMERRQQNRAIINGKTWEEREFLAKFPGWNESTVGYLHSLFLSFFKDEDKMLDFRGFLCVLECLGDRSDHSKRLKRFENADTDNDGMIDYAQYLELIYNYDSAPKKSTGHLAKRCYKAADKAQFVNSLPMEKQLEYGLF